METMVCPECGGEMRRGCLTGLLRVHWTPFQEESKRFRIVFSRPKPLYGWSCDECGLVRLGVKK